MKRESEWLVSDPQGAFAMGTSSGIRTRKYHGFYLGTSGRSQTAYLMDLDFECQGISLWPHLYLSPQGLLQNPVPESQGFQPKFQDSPKGPIWRWQLPDGELLFRVVPAQPAGIAIQWDWVSRSNQAVVLKVRGFWAMRDLHSLGGHPWAWKSLDLVKPSHSIGARQVGLGGRGILRAQEERLDGFCLFRGAWEWSDDPIWYENFYYPIEKERGYPDHENLYSAGFFEVRLQSGDTCDWVSSVDPQVLEVCDRPFLTEAGVEDVSDQSIHRSSRSRLFDFQLKSPAGIVAGFPWFGEWGRDTFVSLPGLAAVWVESERSSLRFDASVSWIRELMSRWGSWIQSAGALPNFLEKDGKVQWESCDATLWWCHALAALWSYTLVFPEFYPSLRSEFFPLLNAAIQSIRDGRHPFVRVLENGLLEVTQGHTSWMDARIHGQAVTPRVGLLPEINALWFQALVLQEVWTKEMLTKGFLIEQQHRRDRFTELKNLGKKVLECRESSRPNFVFLHSIPLAPSFVVPGCEGDLEADMAHLFNYFWTPVGMRTLSPADPHYQPHYLGHPSERDAAYHQGPAWAWLGGHFEVARDRLSRIRSSNQSTIPGVDPAVLRAKMLPPTILNEMPIPGHVAELFDGLPPFVSRGAPAQAWSLACWEEAQFRHKWKIDQKLAQFLANYLNRGSFG